MNEHQPNLRDHLEMLEEMGLLLRINKQVEPTFEAAALIKQATNLDKAIYFEKVRGKNHPVVANVAGSRKMISLALRVPEGSLLRELADRAAKNFETKLVSNAPVQEIERDPSEISEVPLFTYFEKDVGNYITAGTVIAKDPETGFRNSSFNRMMYRDDLRLGIRMMPPQHLGTIQNKAETKERNLEVAIVLGNHPAEMIASASALPFGKDHLNFSSSLRGYPLETVKCKSVDLEVPANAEIVIEGEVEAHVREEEGPFGEFMDYYVGRGKNHVIKIKKITSRTDYMSQALLCGSKEDLGILALTREMAVYSALRDSGSEVVDVSLMPFLFNGVVAIKKKFDEEPKSVLTMAFATYSWLKYCIVVDEDVDVHNLSDVWWALGTRSQPDKGLLTIAGAPGFPRKDKLQIHRGKVGIDSTVPLDLKEEFARKKIPKESGVDLSKFL